MICWFVPWIVETMAMIDAIPMITPSIVRNDRSL